MPKSALPDFGYHVYLNDGNGNYNLIHEGSSFQVLKNAYSINPSKTSCNKAGHGSLETSIGVSFDNTGALTKTIADDECYVYLEQQPLAQAIVASAGLSSGNGQIVNENGYRFEGANPNNYICLGTTTSPCPADNLYRIIGAFNEYNNSSGSFANSYVTKVIKNKTYNNNASYYWNSNYSNYSSSNNSTYLQAASFNGTIGANQIYNTMNSIVYNSLDSSLKSQIATSRFWFRCNWTQDRWSYNWNVDNIYTYERSGSAYWSSGYVDCNIALINISDYKYATLASNCSRNDESDYGNSCGQNNWIGKMMYSNSSSSNWIINPPGGGTPNSYHHAGALSLIRNSSYQSMYISTMNNMSSMFNIFPVFYLKNQSKVIKGFGIASNPYYISI